MRMLAGIVASGACILASPIVGLAGPGCDQPAKAAVTGAPDTATSDAASAATAPAHNGGSGGAANAVPPARAGRWIQVDPQTGQPVAPPPGTRAAIAADPRFSTSQQGLLEQPDAGGGVMIDLQGRFRSAATATVGADGKPDLDCVAPGTAAREVKP